MPLTRILLQQIYSGVGYIPTDRITEEQMTSAILNAGTIDRMVMPLSMKLETEQDWWVVPIEPMISLSGENDIIRRSVAKTSDSGDVRGTVKERWGTQDYNIEIVGQLRNWDDSLQYPRSDVERLRYYCEAKRVIQVQCPLLEIFNITQIAIGTYNVPFTKGEDMQAYSIIAYSDFKFELLIETQG